MRNTDKLRVLNELYDEIYSRYETVDNVWKKAFEVDDYNGMKESSYKRSVYTDVLGLLVEKMKEV